MKKKPNKRKTWAEKVIAHNSGLISKKEMQVLLLLVLGYENEEIQNKLGITYETLKTHRTYILKKMELENVVQLTHVALRQGLITSTPLNKEVICVGVTDRQRAKLIELTASKKITVRKYCEDVISKILKAG